MSVKNKLLQEINKKAQKIRDKRVQAASNKTIEAVVFEFFKNVEETRQLHGGLKYDYDIFKKARISLNERIKTFDRGAKTSIEMHSTEENQPVAEQQVAGVTIWWSEAYIKLHNVEPSLYIDVGQMLFN